MVKHCIHCGQTLPPGAKFCPECGKPTISSDNQLEIPHLKLWILVYGLAFIAIFICVVLMFMNRASHPPNISDTPLTQQALTIEAGQ